MAKRALRGEDTATPTRPDVMGIEFFRAIEHQAIHRFASASAGEAQHSLPYNRRLGCSHHLLINLPEEIIFRSLSLADFLLFFFRFMLGSEKQLKKFSEHVIFPGVIGQSEELTALSEGLLAPH